MKRAAEDAALEDGCSLDDIADDAPLMAEEQFCPAIPVTTYDTLEEAITRANNTQFGLCASVWGRDTEKAFDVARRIEAGQVWVNTHGVLAINHLAPYGGVKQSGWGRELGTEGMDALLETKHVSIGIS